MKRSVGRWAAGASALAVLALLLAVPVLAAEVRYSTGFASSNDGFPGTWNATGGRADGSGGGWVDNAGWVQQDKTVDTAPVVGHVYQLSVWVKEPAGSGHNRGRWWVCLGPVSSWSRCSEGGNVGTAVNGWLQMQASNTATSDTTSIVIRVGDGASYDDLTVTDLTAADPTPTPAPPTPTPTPTPVPAAGGDVTVTGFGPDVQAQVDSWVELLQLAIFSVVFVGGVLVLTAGWTAMAQLRR